MKGYHGLPRDTEEVLCDGWLRTGDLGSIDEDGFLHFAGLKKRIFNLTGMKVDPTEVESVGRLHPCVKDVTVHEETIAGILPRKLLVAEVSLHQNADVDEKDLRAFYKEKVSWYKIPSRMIITTLEEA